VIKEIAACNLLFDDVAARDLGAVAGSMRSQVSLIFGQADFIPNARACNNSYSIRSASCPVP
jgi:hypothetical protein